MIPNNPDVGMSLDEAISCYKEPIAKLCQKYRHSNNVLLDVDDLIAVGLASLLKSYPLYRTDRSNSERDGFEKYVLLTANNHIRNYIRDYGSSSFRTPRRIRHLYLKAKRMDWLQMNPALLAHHLGILPEEAEAVLAYTANRFTLSLNAEVDQQRESALSRLVKAENQEEIEQRIIMKQFIATLTSEQQLILKMTYQGYRQREIGERLGVTQVTAGRKLNEIKRLAERYLQVECGAAS